jgi:polyisoprenyl-phosphate glycosyltransferase
MQPLPYDFHLSVVIPVYNDEEVLPELQRRLGIVLEKLSDRYEAIFVDDGSRDRSFKVLRELKEANSWIKIVQLTRNFGQSAAIDAGLEIAEGELIVLMDSDLQDRPEDIPALIEAMLEQEAPLAIARWSTRDDSRVKVFASRAFNAVANKVTDVRYLPRGRAFRVMRREVVDQLRSLPEKTATSLGLLYWLGYKLAAVDLPRDSRYAGHSGYTLRRLMKLSVDRLFSHSLFPIRIASLLGVTLGVISLLLAAYFVIQKLFLEKVVPGWTSIVVIVLFLQGISFIFMGIIGEYLGRIYVETKNRPKYVVRQVYK